MRVISGVCGGLPLKVLDGQTTRPTTDKVKESMFNIVGPYFEGGQALDLFAGSGGLGIECLSRGIEKAVFVEKDSRAAAIVKQNLSFCKMDHKSVVMNRDAKQAIREMAGVYQFDYVFLDPPYKMAEKIPELIEEMVKANIVSEDCIFVCESGSETTFPDELSYVERFREGKYGTIRVSYYQLKEGVLND
ncbi:MAG: rsmD [Bacillales bacterium]|jgi:16S rRNA (guanine(966)-N(2))-methyltransferase RsmD|nr:rsmD [Bacillales bacterium]